MKFQTGAEFLVADANTLVDKCANLMFFNGSDGCGSVGRPLRDVNKPPN
jgi:hypothetical protein